MGNFKIYLDKTPLQLCSAMHDGCEMVIFLLKQGADPNLKDKTGRTALEIAKHLEREKTIKILQDWKQKGFESNNGTTNFGLTGGFGVFAKVEELNNQILEEIKKLVEKKENEIKKLTNIINTLKDEYDTLKDENNTLKDENDTLTDENNSLIDENNTLIDENDNLKSEQSGCNQKLQKIKNENYSLKKELIQEREIKNEIQTKNRCLRVKMMYETSLLFKLNPKLRDLKIGKRLAEKSGGKGFYGACSAVYEIEFFEKKFAMKVLLNYDTETQESHALNQQFDSEINFLMDQKRLPWIPEILPIYYKFNDVIDTKKMDWDYNSDFVHQKTLFIISSLGNSNLKQIITKRQKGEVPYFSNVEMISLMKQMLMAISHLKKHFIVHRDIKPDNFIFTDEECNSISLIDFGFALDAKEECEHDTFLFKYHSIHLPKGGSPYYLAPEITKTLPGKNIYLDYSKNDDFSLGLVFYQMLSKEEPFGDVKKAQWSDQYLKEISNIYSKEIREIIYGLLKINPKERMALDDALDLLEEIKSKEKPKRFQRKKKTEESEESEECEESGEKKEESKKEEEKLKRNQRKKKSEDEKPKPKSKAKKKRDEEEDEEEEEDDE